MGILRNLVSTKRYESGQNYELGQSLGSTGVATLFGTGGQHIDVLKEYSGFVWKCINVRSEDLSAVTFFIERQVGQGDNAKWHKDTNHEFNTVLEGVDGGYDLSELLEAHQVSMDMYGESFWYFSKGMTSSKPFAVYLLDPAYVTVYISGDRVTGYMYDRNGEHLIMDLDEIAHFRIHNPQNRYRGAGPMQKAGWFIKSSRYVTTYVNNFLENNAIPAGVIVGDVATPETEWKLFVEAWKNKYSGIDASGKTGFVRGSNLKFEKTGLSLGEVDFDKVKNSSRDDILAMFSMPKSKLGLYEDFNKASSVTSDQQFAKSFTQPAVRRVTRRLSRKVGVWYGQQFQIGSDFSIPEDRVQRLNEYDRGFNRWFTTNETREAFGQDKLTGAEFDTIPPNAPIAPTPTNPTKTLGKVILRTKNTTNGYSYEMKENFRSKTEDIQKKYELQFLEATNKVLLDQKQRVLDQLQPKKIANASLDVKAEAQALSEATLAVELALALEQGDLAAAFAGNADTTFKLTEVMRNYIRDSISKSATSFTQETVDKIAKLLADGLQAGDSLASIAKEVGQVYDEVTGVKTPGYRIERLARTEIIKTSNQVTEAAYIQTGVVKKKEWFANPGCCEFCSALKGSVINLGQTFVAKGSTLEGADGGTRLNDYEDVEHPPVHPSCRCTLVPVIEGMA